MTSLEISAQGIHAMCVGYDCISPMMEKEGKIGSEIQHVNILYFDLHCHYFKGIKVKQQGK